MSIQCVRCGGVVDRDLLCRSCGHEYERVDGVPVLIDELDPQKQGQASWFDEDADDEWEIERPHGAPAFHRWLLAEKLRRGTRALELRGASALVVCGGSGMEAEVLTRHGARVVTADLSLGAARRALERARRHHFQIESVVADAERLPFADRSFDVVFVHDGLHHLERPRAALAEMARVAGRAVSINEPARAIATRAAVRVGVAVDVEDAGNRVERLDLAEVQAELSRLGLRVVAAERYAMYYKHEPGTPTRVLSSRSLLPLARAGFLAANVLLGRFGNKLTVQAVRP